MTHRQHIVWQMWLREEWEKPNRSDHYIMQVAEAVNLSGQELKWPLRFEFKEPAVTTKAVEKQFEELKEQGFKVPRRMSKEDIEKAKQAMRHAELNRVKPKLRPPL
jgi:hypothetical protein